VAVFDDEDRAHGWRHQRLPEYKAGRAPMPETLEAEMPALRAAFEQRGIRCWALAGNEADDLAATLAVKVAHAGHQATIVSTDKGYCQLLSPTIRSATTFRNAGWTPLSSPKSSASRRSSCLITGGWRGSAAQKSRAWRGLAQRAPPSC
jgi:protein Xni